MRGQVKRPAGEDRDVGLQVFSVNLEQWQQAELAHIGADRIALGVGVHGVKHKAGVGLKPDEVLAPSVAWHDSDACSEFRLPAYGRTGGQIFRAERSRKNHEDDVLSGGNEIVHHGRHRQGNLFVPRNVTVRGDDRVAQIGRERSVTKKEEFTRFRIDLGMSGHGSLELAVKIVHANGFEG